VTLIAFNACGSDTIFETIQVSAVEKFDKNEFIKVFPNPAKDIIYIHFSNLNEQKITLEILNLNGQKILQRDQRYIDNDQIIDINLSSQPEGIYFLKIQLEDRLYTYKLVLIRNE
ncbi:MAG: T9SS type A sorting domain-containing protein, partial [Bacteroidales bacterium]|nr:T9SS type A sorting domain-containing protein [Bacteroidales bacterium]